MCALSANKSYMKHTSNSTYYRRTNTKITHNDIIDIIILLFMNNSNRCGMQFTLNYFNFYFYEYFDDDKETSFFSVI